MRIARILTRLNLGGPARQVLASDPLLVERGHVVRVFAGEPEPGEGDLTAALEAKGVEVVRVPHLARGVNPVKDVMALRFLKKALTAFEPDIVHTHASKAGLLGRRAARVLDGRAALLHTFHGHVLEGGPRELIGASPDALVIGVVGRLAEVKRPEVALQAFLDVAERHPLAELVFIGDGGGRRDLESRIEALEPELAKRVHMVGALTDTTAAGVPAVAPAVGGISEIIAHDRTGYVANEDDELAMHLDTLLSDAAMRQVFGQRARMRVGDRHSAPALARRLEDHYAFLTAQRQTTN